MIVFYGHPRVITYKFRYSGGDVAYQVSDPSDKLLCIAQQGDYIEIICSGEKRNGEEVTITNVSLMPAETNMSLLPYHMKNDLTNVPPEDCVEE